MFVTRGHGHGHGHGHDSEQKREKNREKTEKAFERSWMHRPKECIRWSTVTGTSTMNSNLSGNL
jgi:hypothetical protein